MEPLCNGAILFEDTGELLPDGRVIAPRRPTDTAALQGAVRSQLASLSTQFVGAQRLLGGTARGGKTSAAAAMHRFALAPDPDRADASANHPSV